MHTPTQASFSGRLWLDKSQQRFLGKGRVELLGLIDELGSITKAAKAMGMSYKAAWESVERMTGLSDVPLVVRVRGGVHGGETRLTDYGREMVQMFRVFHEEHNRFLAALSNRLVHARTVESLMRRFGMRTSARNEYWGTVASIRRGAVHSEVTLDVGGMEPIVATVTNGSVETLDLSEGKEACALIEASFVLLAAGEGSQRTSARNCFAGKVAGFQEGAVNAEVTLGLKGGRTIVATAPNDGVRALGLAVGQPAYALVKASQVILAVND